MRAQAQRLTVLTKVAAVAAAFTCGRTDVVRYVELPTFTDAGADAGVDAGEDAGPCQPRVVPLNAAVPTVMFVIDRSGSMQESLDGRTDAGPSKWSVLRASLGSVLPARDQQLAMGALLYPTANSTSCSAPAAVNLSPALGNAASVLGLISGTPVGGTPTWGGVDVAAKHVLNLRLAGSARALVLTTDGAPNCNSALNPNSCVCTQQLVGSPPRCPSSTSCLDDLRVISRLTDLATNSKLPTYVVGLGQQLGRFSATLDAMAVAGGVPRTGAGHRYYSADSQAELIDAFSRITAQLTRCTFLAGSPLGVNDRFVLRVGSAQVAPIADGGTDGWEWLNRANGELTLRGAPCDQAVSGQPVTALVACD